MVPHLWKDPLSVRDGPKWKLRSNRQTPQGMRGWWWLLFRLAPMVAVGLIPFVVLLFTSKNDLRHYVSSDLLAALGGGWAIFAIWVTLDKGMDGLLAREPTEIAWSLIGMSNLVGVLFFFVHLRE